MTSSLLLTWGRFCLISSDITSSTEEQGFFCFDLIYSCKLHATLMKKYYLSIAVPSSLLRWAIVRCRRQKVIRNKKIICAPTTNKQPPHIHNGVHHPFFRGPHDGASPYRAGERPTDAAALPFVQSAGGWIRQNENPQMVRGISKLPGDPQTPGG